MMNSTAAYVPPIPDTDWTPQGDFFTAPATDAFWRLYRVGKGHLYEIGIKCTREGSDWLAIYIPGKATPEVIERVLLKVDDEAMMNDAVIARERERIAEEKRLKAEAKAREYQEWLAENADEMKATQAEAKALFEKYKDACAQPKRMSGWIETYPLSRFDYYDLQRALVETRKKIARFDNFEGFHRARSPYAGWPHEKVATGLRFLTGRDSDHAALANDEGWSSADSSAGHYCCAILDDHYEDAIQRARQFIGSYEGQLRRAGIL